MTTCKFLLLILIAATASAVFGADAKLSTNYYSSTCPKIQSIVEEGIIKAIKNETRIGASLLRLHFHDCFVNGCDASVLLDDTGSFIGEKTAVPNNNSARGFNVIDDIKAKVEKACPRVVSCADILALAARDSVVYLGGPFWEVGLGRRDSTTASRSLSLKDLVALAGGHTIGLSRCTSFRARIYNDSNIDASFAKSLQNKCPRSGNDNNLAPLDLQTPTFFDNSYFKNLVNKKGLLHSDQELFNGSSSDSLVEKYAADNAAFFKDFAKSIVKMSNIKPLTGSKGQIRVNCRKVN
ncbi:Peroxidase [Quillaja saponaria]|uniref:Peroxidase n=1 Tax=Quillaja saponaria TaxID=32244 RepID=A0AAD7LK38_QUISA|nr:Peroxidase [Quillaja saponaria]